MDDSDVLAALAAIKARRDDADTLRTAIQTLSERYFYLRKKNSAESLLPIVLRSFELSKRLNEINT